MYGWDIGSERTPRNILITFAAIIIIAQLLSNYANKDK